MNTISTGIAVALALGIMAFFFIPGLFRSAATQQSASIPPGADLQVGTSTANISGATTTNQATMTPESATPITELKMKDVVTGTGPAAKAGDTVTVNYVGMLTNGKVFDASANHGSTGFSFTLGAGQVIKGWDEGLVGMQVGGKRELLIPAALAYGDRAMGDAIPANSPLIFEVEMVKIGR